MAVYKSTTIYKKQRTKNKNINKIKIRIRHENMQHHKKTTFVTYLRCRWHHLLVV